MDNRLFYLLTKTQNAMSIYIKQQFSNAGLKVTPSQLAILFILKNKNSQTMTELSLELDTDNSAVTRVVDRMEKSGLVQRNNSSNDRREYHITITDDGIAETERVKKVIAAINRKIENEIPAKEIVNLNKTLIKMYSLFKE